MIMKFENTVKMLMKSAKEKGASSAKLIPAKDIFVEDYVRLKCKFGCIWFGKRFTCPPYSPTPNETRKILRSYSKALLIEFTGLRDREGQSEVNEIMYELEREAFLNGLHKTFAYVAGPCRVCETCPAESVENPSEFSST